MKKMISIKPESRIDFKNWENKETQLLLKKCKLKKIDEDEE